MKIQAVIHELPVIETVSNEELLRLMAGNNENPIAASLALAEFYKRHKKFLEKCLHKEASDWLDDDAKLDFVHDTFLRAFEKAHTFKGRELQDEIAERKLVRKWLSTIATNLLRDWLRARKELRFESFDDDKIRAEADSKLSFRRFARFQQSPENGLLHEAFSSLSERERDVLRIYGIFVEFEDKQLAVPDRGLNELARKQLTIPDKELDELARNLNISKDNIRQIKHRALEKIKNFIHLHAHQKGTASNHEQRKENTGANQC
jgi:RNA polymerase sigma factor (sigma-70 family)